MLRVHFTADDVARVRVATAADPLWEITNSFQALAEEDHTLAFGDWRRQVRPLLGPADGLLAALLPPRGYSPDFLTPEPPDTPNAPSRGGTLDLESAVDTVLRTPKSVLRGDLRLLAASSERPQRLVPAGVRELAEGEPAALRRLGATLHTYHRRALAPFSPHIRAQVDADLAARARAALTGGTDGLLASFRPVLRWEPPVLEADYPVERELWLGGRGCCSSRPSSAPEDPSCSPPPPSNGPRSSSIRSSTPPAGPGHGVPPNGTRNWACCSGVPGPRSWRTS